MIRPPAALHIKHVVCQLVAVQRFCDENFGASPTGLPFAVGRGCWMLGIGPDSRIFQRNSAVRENTGCSIPLQAIFDRNFSAFQTLK
jgi:hypothetical protein